MKAPAYDPHADWYEEYVTARVTDYTERVRDLIRSLLGAGHGRCLDVCCGTGAHAATLRGLGWEPVGIDLSGGQLRYAATRLPVAAGDAAALPVADRSVDAAVCVLAHTDVTVPPLRNFLVWLRTSAPCGYPVDCGWVPSRYP